MIHEWERIELTIRSSDSGWHAPPDYCWRLRVPQGWLYRLGTLPYVFVPDEEG